MICTGKKASVIEFGSEWHAVSPEERLRRHKASLSPDPGNESKSTPLLGDASFTTLSRQNSEVKPEEKFEVSKSPTGLLAQGEQENNLVLGNDDSGVCRL